MLEQDVVAFAQLWVRLVGKENPFEHPTDVVYIPGLSDGMRSSCDLMALAARRAKRSGANIAFNGDVAEEAQKRGWPGAEVYEETFRNMGVKHKKLFRTGPGLHTRSECDEFVKLAKDKRWEVATIVTVPYHWPRFLACIVGSMHKYNYWVCIYFARPTVVNYYEPMVGSQGKEQNSTFLEEAGADVKRFCNYLEKGRENGGKAWINQYGAPIEKIMDYLDRCRDAEP